MISFLLLLLQFLSNVFKILSLECVIDSSEVKYRKYDNLLHNWNLAMKKNVANNSQSLVNLIPYKTTWLFTQFLSLWRSEMDAQRVAEVIRAPPTDRFQYRS